MIGAWGEFLYCAEVGQLFLGNCPVMFKEPCREIGTVTCFLGESKMENSIG
jgi:hypothetical protein